jgi:hypothetical protein
MVRFQATLAMLCLAACATTPAGVGPLVGAAVEEGAGQACAAGDATLGPMADVMRNRVGAWNVRADLQLTPNARQVVIEAEANTRLVGDRWLVTELRDRNAAPGMPAFEGLGVNGFDPDRCEYVGYWVDGSRGIAVSVRGAFDPATGVFRTTSEERRRDGATITVVSETRSVDADTEQTTFLAPDENGRPYTRMVLTYVRANR